MKVEFNLNKGWNDVLSEVVEYESNVTDEQLDKDYVEWLCENTDGYWSKVDG